MALSCRTTLGLPERGARLQSGSGRSGKSSCRTPVFNSASDYNINCSNNKQRARAVLAQGSPAAQQPGCTCRHAAAPAAAAAAVLRNTRTAASSSNCENSFEDGAAVPVHARPGSRIEAEKPYELDGLPLTDGTLDGTNYDSQIWEEMTALLSFDGEEHKYVMRHMPGAGMRVEDMFASFDGDDFEAVMTAALHSSEPHGAAGAVAKSAAAVSSRTTNSSFDNTDEFEDLFLAVSRRRAAAMAVEAATKQSPTPKRRKAPLGSEASDAWMFQVPASAAAQLQILSMEQQYEAAQRALLPPLDVGAASPDALARQQPAGVRTAGAEVAAAKVAPTQPAAKEQQVQQQEAVVVLVQRPDAGDPPVSPAPHAAHAQPAGELLLTESNNDSSSSSSSRVGAAGLLSAAAAVGQARPAASASEGMLGAAGVGAVPTATQQRQHGEVQNVSSRVFSSAPVLLAPLVAATAEMAGSASASRWWNAGTEAAKEAEARARLSALPLSDQEEHESVVFVARVMGGSSSSNSKTGDSCRLTSAFEAGLVAGPMYSDGVASGSFDYMKARQPAGRAALRRAMSKLRCSRVLADKPDSSSCSSDS